MRRHPALQDLSRDHFVALHAVVRVRRLVERDAFSESLQDVWDAFLALTRHPLPGHFEEEERLLLPLLVGEARRAHGARLEEEHAALRTAFTRLAGMAPDADALWEVAQALRSHVRWEEDSLFEALQGWLGEDELARLGEESDRFRASRGLTVGPA